MIDELTFKKKRMACIAEKAGADLVIASLAENILYLTGYYSVNLQMSHSAETYVVANPATGRTAIIAPAADVPTIVENTTLTDIYAVGDFRFFGCKCPSDLYKRLQEALKVRYKDMASAMKQAVADIGDGARRILMDESRMTPLIWEKLCLALAPAEVVFGFQSFLEMRTIKHPDEVEKLRTATHITETAMLKAIRNIKKGDSDSKIVADYAAQVAAMGAVPFYRVATVGERSAFVDTCVGKDCFVKEGSIIRFDIGCIYEGYRSDMSRTVVAGKNPKAEDYYKGLLEGELRAIDKARAGTVAEEIFETAVNTVRKTIPHYDRHHTGHGIGLNISEPPAIALGNKTELTPGMVLCIETPYYELGWGGVQVEDTLLITEAEPVMLTESLQELYKVEL